MNTFDVLGVAGTSRLVGPLWTTAGPPYIFGQVAHPAREQPLLALAIYGAPCRTVGDIQALDGLFMAVRRSVVEQIRFDPIVFSGFHLYDLDFTYRAYLAGFRLGVANDLYVFHRSCGCFDEVWQQYAQRFSRKHGASLPRVESRWHQWTVAHVKDKESLVQIMTPSYWDLPR